jgi:hypothetical protein
MRLARSFGFVAAALAASALVGCGRTPAPAEPQSGLALAPSVSHSLIAIATATRELEPEVAPPPREQSWLHPEAARTRAALLEEARGLAQPICATSPGSVQRHYQSILERAEPLRVAFEEILADPESDPVTVGCAFSVIRTAKLRGQRFCDLAVSRLRDESDLVREAAVAYLGHHGSPWEARHIASLLSDRDPGVRRNAARTLARIGGYRELEAMDAWLKVGKNPNPRDGDYLILVKKCRGELEQRLKTNPVPKDLIN